MKKDVTLIIPVYNQKSYLVSAIDSALVQTFKNYEVLVIDDGSNDSTANILKKFSDKLTVIRKDNGGTSSAWNLALKYCESKYVIGLDSDDELYPDTIEKMMTAASFYPNADIHYSDYVFIDKEGEVTKEVENPDPVSPIEMLFTLHENLGKPNNFLPFGHVRLYKREALLAIGGFNEKYRHAEDFELVLRMAGAGMIFSHVKSILYKYRWHDTNKSVLERKAQKAEVGLAVQEFKMRNNCPI